MKKPRLQIILAAVVVLLLIPFIAMYFTDEVSWTLSDFVVMGLLLLSTGLLIEFALRKVSNSKARIALCLAILGAFLLVWAELAVGIFETIFRGH